MRKRREKRVFSPPRYGGRSFFKLHLQRSPAFAEVIVDWKLRGLRRPGDGSIAMNIRSSLAGSVIFVSLSLGGLGVGSAYADDDGDSGAFRWMACAGMQELGFLGFSGVGCPDAAVASNGDMIEIVGEGTLEIDNGEPEDVSGGGSYRQTNESGNVLDVGTFTATKLKSFESFGGSASPALPSNWRLGRALIRVRMVSDFDGKTRKATLTVGCILPEPIEGPPPADLFEGVTLDVKNGQSFDMSVMRATLFIQLGEHDDDD